jgi:hypothetical protein
VRAAAGRWQKSAPQNGLGGTLAFSKNQNGLPGNVKIHLYLVGIWGYTPFTGGVL